MCQQSPVTLDEIKQENWSNQESWKSTRLLSVNENNVKYRMMRNAEAPWHRHEDSDELFIVQTGTRTIDVRDEAGNAPLDGNVEFRRISLSEECAIWTLKSQNLPDHSPTRKR